MIYPFDVIYAQDGENKYWVAKSSSLKGCIGQGNEVYDAIKELEENEKMWLETAKELGIEIPDVPVGEDSVYSGKLSLRMSPAVHKKAAIMASRQGVSLNQYINDAIVNYNAELFTGKYIGVELSSITNGIKQELFVGTTAR